MSRHLNGEDFKSLQLPEIVYLEDTLVTGLRRVENQKASLLEHVKVLASKCMCVQF